jgi:hypothetical protein
MCPLKHDVFPRFWRAAGEAHNCRWTAKWLYSRNDWNPKECTYLGPALTPAEVEARMADALKWRGAINDWLTNWLSPIEDHEKPSDALQRLIRLEVMAALDPKVSQSAADLVADAHKEWLAELTHDTDALMEAARQSALAEATRLARHYATIVPMHGSLKCDIYEAAAQAATEIAASIEALSDTPPGMVLVPREPTDAMIHAGGYALQEHAALTMDAARIAWDAMVKAAEKGETND